MYDGGVYGTDLYCNDVDSDTDSTGICTSWRQCDFNHRLLFGPVVGALAGGIGSAMADILTGYPVWAVPTLLIKTIMPLIACYIFQNKVSRKPVISVRVLVGAVVTLLFMTAGYVFFGGILYGSWALGLASAPGLLLKSAVNLIVFIVVGTGLSKVVKNR